MAPGGYSDELLARHRASVGAARRAILRTVDLFRAIGAGKWIAAWDARILQTGAVNDLAFHLGRDAHPNKKHRRIGHPWERREGAP